ncbi:MAG: hypothetical protein HY675_05035 [Chloroflexi bacterium]|nr:hypothetical protein [Chloroflexota bacterium]
MRRLHDIDISLSDDIILAEIRVVKTKCIAIVNMGAAFLAGLALFYVIREIIVNA